MENTRTFLTGNNRSLFLKAMMLCLLVGFSATMDAQSGITALSSANSTIRSYWDPMKLIIAGIGAIVGVVGAVRVFNKWNSGDNNIGKEVVAWGGSALFLVIAPSFIGSFFGL